MKMEQCAILRPRRLHQQESVLTSTCVRSTDFSDIETLKDVTAGELIYVLGNILRSSRYGAISSRVGKVRNELIGRAFSDCELYSNLELTELTWENLKDGDNEPTLPLDDDAVRTAAQQAMATLRQRVVGVVKPVSNEALAMLLAEVQDLYADEAGVKTVMDELQAMYSK